MDANYRRAFIDDDKEETFEESSRTVAVQVTKRHQVVDNIVSCSVLFDHANHHLPHVGSQSYVDETLEKESSTLDIVDEAILREANKENEQANEEHPQVGIDLDLMPANITVTQVVTQVALA